MKCPECLKLFNNKPFLTLFCSESCYTAYDEKLNTQKEPQV